MKGDSEDNVSWHRVERSTARGSQSLRFPDSADMATVQAELQNGLLCVCIKKKATLRRRQLQIGGGAAAGLPPAIQQQERQQLQQQQAWPSETAQERGVSGGGEFQQQQQQRVPISGGGVGMEQGRGAEYEQRQGAKAGEPAQYITGGGGMSGAGRAMEREEVPKVGDKLRGHVAAGTGIGGVGAALGERGAERGAERGGEWGAQQQQPVSGAGISGGMRETYPGAEASHLVKGPTYGEATSPGTVTGGERKKEGILEPEYVATPAGKEGLLEEETEPRQHKGLGERLKEGFKEAVGMGGEREVESERGERGGAYGEGGAISGRVGGSGAAKVMHATERSVLEKFGAEAVPSGGTAVRERGQEVQGSGI